MCASHEVLRCEIKIELQAKVPGEVQQGFCRSGHMTGRMATAGGILRKSLSYMLQLPSWYLPLNMAYKQMPYQNILETREKEIENKY